MRIIADTNILAQAIIIKDEATWDVLKESGIYCPDLLFAEFGNVLMQYVRYRNYDLSHALVAFEIAKELVTEVLYWENLFYLIQEKSLQHNLSFYDAIYLSLAIQYEYPLFTRDKKLAQAAAHEKIGFEG